MIPWRYFYIRQSGRGGLAPKFASEIRVRAPNFASKHVGDKYLKFWLLNFRYDPKICAVDLCEFSWTVYSHGQCILLYRRDYVTILPIVVPELPKFFLLFGDLTPNFASELEARSKPPDLLIRKYPLGL